METLYTALGLSVAAAVIFWLFVLEPRRKIYDHK